MTTSETATPEPLKPEHIALMQRHIAGGTPHAKAIGMTLEKAARGHAWLTLPYQSMFVGDNRTGVMHGGVITALLDHTAGAAVQVTQPIKAAIATLDLRIDYMKPAVSGVAVHAHAHCYKMTKNIAFVRATAYQNGEDDLIANSVATFMLSANRTLMGRDAPAKLPEASPRATPPRDPRPSDGSLGLMPYAQFLGVEVEKEGPTVTSILRFGPHLIGNPVLPALHGGAIGAFLETSAMVQVAAEMGGGRSPKPIGLTINYLRSGRPVDTFARTTITKEGRRVAAIAVEAWQDDRQKPIASAYGHFLLKPD
ncbi:PaaI family thioesterase [Chelatococcus reniformis]|uniref:Phenylacetic acid degradation protein n=1 Tax=Chelatococcus reniformis TaxID=1494448 RepID=A0A916UG85_9HYPH|nr:PaaI family thioesterase [Chelatococcus reniformis]GGC71845.1 phenylacetic acid degradation protein [Chelatococcus reniformis]